MKNKMRIISIFSLFLLSSCSNNNNDNNKNILNTDLNYNNYYLNIRENANTEGHHYKNKEKEILDKDLIKKTLDTYKYMIDNKLEYIDWTDVDGFEACNYYIIRFGDESHTGIYIDTKDDNNVFLYGYNEENKWQMNWYKVLDEYSKKYVDEVKPIFKEMLDSTEWVLD